MGWDGWIFAAVEAPPYKSLIASEHFEIKNSSYGEFRVDWEGFEPATSSVRWIKWEGKRGEKTSITSKMYQNHHTVRAYLYPNCSRIVPRYASVLSKERRPIALSRGGKKR